MKHSTPVLLAIAATVLLPTISFAEDGNKKPRQKPEGHRDGPPMPPEERLKMMTEKLGLSPEQQSKIRAIMESSAPELRSLISKGRENLSEDEKKKVMDLMKEQRDQIGDVLTAEQKEKMREMKNGHGPGAKGGPDGGKGRKGGPDEKGDKGGDGKKKHGDKKGAE